MLSVDNILGYAYVIHLEAHLGLVGPDSYEESDNEGEEHMPHKILTFCSPWHA